MFKAADQTELPVEQPVTSELALNLKTAASLGKTFPDSVGPTRLSNERLPDALPPAGWLRASQEAPARMGA